MSAVDEPTPDALSAWIQEVWVDKCLGYFPHPFQGFCMVIPVAGVSIMLLLLVLVLKKFEQPAAKKKAD